MKQEKEPLSVVEKKIFRFVDNLRAEARLYPDLWVRDLTDKLTKEGHIVVPPIPAPAPPARDPHDELDALSKVFSAYLEGRFARATNRVRYGVADPTGGRGEVPVPIRNMIRKDR